jgi:allophanate hydrolase subunit 1
MTKIDPVLYPLGEDGLLVEFAPALSMQANAAAIACRDAVSALGLDGVVEVGSTLKSTFMRFDPAVLSRGRAEAALRDVLGQEDWSRVEAPAARAWRLPSCFDADFAPQLEEFAGLAGRSAADLLDELAATPLRVLALGFAPGMPYLGELPAHWNVPRQSGLTPKVPVGAITAAIRQIVLFAVPSGTGWRQIGQAAWRGFDPDGSGPYLSAGDVLRFDPVGPEAFADHLAAGGGLLEDRL